MAVRNEEFKETIDKFVGEVNLNEKVQKLIRKWASSVNIWGRDIGEGYILEVQSGKVTSVTKAASRDDGIVKVIGDAEMLIRMFRGKEKVAHLYLEGVIETYGSERDQIVLDAIARLLWS